MAFAGSSNPEQELIALDEKYQAAIKAQDAKTFGPMLLDNFVLITSSSDYLSKQQVIEQTTDPKLKFTVNKSRDVKVRFYGKDVAVVTAILDQVFDYDGKHYDYPVRFSDTYVRTPDGWKQLSAHASRFDKLP
jgi:protein tyrosine/serine phosphatase